MRMLFVLSLLPLLASCGTPTAPGALEASTSSFVSIVQDGYGRSARFVLCTDDECLRSTPKTQGRLTTRPEGGAASSPARPLIEAPAKELKGSPVQPAALPAAPAPRTKHYVVRFAVGQFALSPASRAVLDDALKDAADAERIEIRGRTDVTGGKSLNDRLAWKRADVVKRYLLRARQSIAPLVHINAEGRCCYAAPNDSDAARQLNRRAELDIYIVPANKNQKTEAQ